jgi:hypothetical protein
MAREGGPRTITRHCRATQVPPYQQNFKAVQAKLPWINVFWTESEAFRLELNDP